MRVVVFHQALGESTEVISEVVVTSPPKIPLQIQSPEVNRKISRITGASGSATPKSDIRVSLGGGTATTKANAGGAWSVGGLTSNQSGPLKLQVENLSTGEVIERDVEVEYFPQWEVAELVLSPLVDGNGLVTKLGAIARGTGEPGYTITLSRDRNPDAPALLEVPVGDDSTWDFRHLSSPPAPPFPGGQLHVRSTGDPVVRPYRVGVQAPLILVPEEGQATGPQPVLSGFASRAFQLVLPDQSTMMVPVAADQSWQVQLPPLPLGIQLITAGDPREARETTRRTILVLQDVPEQD